MNINNLIKIYNKYIFNELKVQEMTKNDFSKWVEKHSIMFNTFNESFHTQIWGEVYGEMNLYGLNPDI